MESYVTGTTPQRTNPTRVIEVKILEALNNGGGGGGVSRIVAGTNISVSPSGGTGVVTVNSSGGGGNAQLVTYTVDPPANPSNTGQPAIAYDPTGNLPTKGWNTGTLTWN